MMQTRRNVPIVTPGYGGIPDPVPREARTRDTGREAQPRPALPGGLLRRFGDLVEHEIAPDFLHGHSLGLERLRAMRALGLLFVRVVQPRQGAAAKLLGAHRGHVDEQETALD